MTGKSDIFIMLLISRILSADGTEGGKKNKKGDWHPYQTPFLFNIYYCLNIRKLLFSSDEQTSSM